MFRSRSINDDLPLAKRSKAVVASGDHPSVGHPIGAVRWRPNLEFGKPYAPAGITNAVDVCVINCCQDAT